MGENIHHFDSLNELPEWMGEVTRKDERGRGEFPPKPKGQGLTGVLSLPLPYKPSEDAFLSQESSITAGFSSSSGSAPIQIQTVSELERTQQRTQSCPPDFSAISGGDLPPARGPPWLVGAVGRKVAEKGG